METRHPKERHVGREGVIRTTDQRIRTARAVVLAGAGGLAVLAAGKFLYLLAVGDWDITQAPIVFLVPTAMLIAGIWLAARGRQGGLWIIGIVSVILLALFISALIRRGLTHQNWADAALVLIGTPLAVAVLLAIPFARRR